MHLIDLSQQSLVRDGPRRALPGGALVEGGRRHAQGPADRLDPEARAVLVDKRAHFGRSWSSSVAKNTDAAFRISFARHFRGRDISRSSTSSRTDRPGFEISVKTSLPQ
jgi:hypothetical protein